MDYNEPAKDLIKCLRWKPMKRTSIHENPKGTKFGEVFHSDEITIGQFIMQLEKDLVENENIHSEMTMQKYFDEKLRGKQITWRAYVNKNNPIEQENEM